MVDIKVWMGELAEKLTGRFGGRLLVRRRHGGGLRAGTQNFPDISAPFLPMLTGQRRGGG